MGKKLLTLLVLMFCYLFSGAQDMLGTWGSNYGGVNSAIQNPAFIANSKLYADINLVGINFGYYHNDSYLEESDSYVYDFLHDSKSPFPKQTAKTNYYKNHRPDFVKANISARELGPAFMINNGVNAYALSFSTRQFVSFNKVPDALAKLTKYGYADAESILHGGYDVNQPINMSGMVWGETAFTYARVLKSDNQDVVTLGVTLKYLMGLGGGFMDFDDIDFGLKDRNTISINRSNIQSGFSLPYDYDNRQDQVGINSSYKYGKGFGTDIGFSIQHNSRQHNIQRFSRLCEQEFEQYDYRFSVSLIDLGYIRFKDNTLSGTLENNKPILYNLRNFYFSSTQNAIDSINARYATNPKDTAISNQKFSVVLPTALTFQFDKKITDNIYVMAGGIIGMPMGRNALSRPSQLVIVPRYESDIFEFSMPLSLYDFSKPRIGASARIFFLTLGTDRLISLGGKRDYYGYDFYASIRLNFMKLFRLNFIKGQCRESFAHPCY